MCWLHAGGIGRRPRCAVRDLEGAVPGLLCSNVVIPPYSLVAVPFCGCVRSVGGGFVELCTYSSPPWRELGCFAVG